MKGICALKKKEKEEAYKDYELFQNLIFLFFFFFLCSFHQCPLEDLAWLQLPKPFASNWHPHPKQYGWGTTFRFVFLFCACMQF